MYPLDRFIGKFMPSNPIVIEAGSHSGSDTLYVNSLWPQSKIYTFEPNPYWHDTVRKSIAPFKNIQFFPIALGDYNGHTDFFEYTTHKAGADSTLPPVTTDTFWTTDQPNSKFANPIKVPVRTLDDWAKENNVDRVDFMWLDMQGAEGHMLRGAANILRETRIIQTEFNIRPIYKGSMIFEEMIDFLADQGFALSIIERQKPDDVQGNAIFYKVKPFFSSPNEVL